MTQTNEDELDALIESAKRGGDLDQDLLVETVYELRARRIQAAAEARLRNNHVALMQLVRSEAIANGDLDQALREICQTGAEVLAVGRASVWRMSEDGRSATCADLCRVDEGTHESGHERSLADFPVYFETLRDQQVIVAHDAHGDPRLAELADLYLTVMGVNSVLDAPIWISGQLVGVFSAEHVGPARNWSTADVHFASVLADFTALAIQSHRRLQSEDQLRETVDVAEKRLRTIEQQRLAIADLSAPIIDVWDDVLAVPIVGLVDTQRSIVLTERLLDRITSSGARSVIVDLTGVDVVDTMTANHLLQMLRATRLLGASCVLSGIRPAIAQTLVELEVDLGELTIARNLEQALRTCLSGRADAPSRRARA